MPISTTRQQRKLYTIIVAEHTRTGVVPSYREMQTLMGLKSTNGVHHLVGHLVERGWLGRTPNRARALDILPQRCRQALGTSARGQVPHVTYTRANAQLFTVESGDGQAKLVPLPPKPG